MDINQDKMNPNKRWCLWKKRIVGSKGSRVKNKSGWGVKRRKLSFHFSREGYFFLSFVLSFFLFFSFLSFSFLFFLSFFLPLFLSFLLSFPDFVFLIHGFCLYFVIVSLCFLMFSGFCFLFDPYLFLFDPYLLFYPYLFFLIPLPSSGVQSWVPCK